MKKHFTSIIILVLSAQMAFAGVIPVEQARKTAAAFFTAAETATRAAVPGDFKLLGSHPDAQTRSSDEAPAMYVFERTSGGYAILAADDVARPVLAYSLNASFPAWDEIPENMMDLLRWYADIIGFARSKGWEPFPDTRADSSLDPANTVQLTTAKWNQGAPFNNLVQEINGKKPPIGCVATSIAIVMKYHKWPKKGVGELPDYEYTKDGVKYHVDGITLGHTYDWDLMPDTYKNYTDEQAAQYARLLYDIAVMCTMSFYPGGSGAGSTSAMKLTKYFGYDKSMMWSSRSIYRASEWESLIKKDLDNGLPVLYSGHTGSGGHAFVIDGYNGRYFSINYGWGGSTSFRPGHDTSSWINFYTLSPIEGHEEDLLTYNESQIGIFHIFPDKGKTAGPEALSAQAWSAVFSLPYNYKDGMSFTLRSWIQNHSQSNIIRSFRYALFDSEGNLKKLLGQKEDVDLPEVSYGSYEAKNVRIDVGIEEGDRLCLTVLGDDKKTWIPLPARRSDQIVFTRRPLSELVELGYEKGFKFDESSYYSSYFTRDLTLWMKTYKDICWKLARKSDGKVFVSSENLLGNRNSSDVSYYGSMVDADDHDNGDALIRIGVLSGSYRLTFLNPATGETMEIDLDI